MPKLLLAHLKNLIKPWSIMYKLYLKWHFKRNCLVLCCRVSFQIKITDRKILNRQPLKFFKGGVTDFYHILHRFQRIRLLGGNRTEKNARYLRFSQLVYYIINWPVFCIITTINCYYVSRLFNVRYEWTMSLQLATFVFLSFLRTHPWLPFQKIKYSPLMSHWAERTR